MDGRQRLRRPVSDGCELVGRGTGDSLGCARVRTAKGTAGDGLFCVPQIPLEDRSGGSGLVV